MGIPAGTVAADVIAARLLPFRLQRRVIVPAGLLVFAPLGAFAFQPGLTPALGLLLVSGLGFAWGAGVDRLLVETAPATLRNRVLALATAGLMFTQGVGFAFWGIAAQFAPPAVVICAAAAAGSLVVVTLRPRRVDVISDTSRCVHPRLTCAHPKCRLSTATAALNNETEQE
jgi:hypothetical protein